jgi:hypothetical protein
MRKNAIITVITPDLDYIAYTLPVMQRYADSIDADLKICRAPAMPGSVRDNAWFYKLRVMQQYTPLYQRVIFMDCDVLIRPGCPSLFDVYPDAGKLYAVDEAGLANREAEAGTHYDVLKSVLPDLEMPLSRQEFARHTYNSGVIVCSSACYPFIGVDLDALYGQYMQAHAYCKKLGVSGFGDQVLLQYYMVHKRTPVGAMAFKHNFVLFGEIASVSNRFSADIVHYVASRKQLIRWDLPVWYPDIAYKLWHTSKAIREAHNFGFSPPAVSPVLPVDTVHVI